jgi:hypothetical protein
VYSLGISARRRRTSEWTSMALIILWSPSSWNHLCHDTIFGKCGKGTNQRASWEKKREINKHDRPQTARNGVCPKASVMRKSYSVMPLNNTVKLNCAPEFCWHGREERAHRVGNAFFPCPHYCPFVVWKEKPFLLMKGKHSPSTAPTPTINSLRPILVRAGT